ncbi:MAG TPA: CoA transferase, partial [Dehalococcoidia bacterium]|nr:CoA transferase [Dehalococcoidia bacterium]
GYRVLDMTIWQQGTNATAMLADFGADVIKIEGPDAPDPGRGLTAGGAGTPMRAYFHNLNRGKRAISIDLKRERGREVLYRLVHQADAFVSNQRYRALKKLGVDYDTLKQINPRIVYGHASGYGPKGPDADLGSMDIMAQARGGLMMVTGDPDGPPMRAGVPLGDHTGSILLAFGLVTALLHRERTGEGQRVDGSLLAGQLCIQSFNITASLWDNNRQPPRHKRGPSPTWNAYQGGDGKWFVLGMNGQRWWPGICRVVGKPEWLTEEPFASLQGRSANAAQVMAALDDVFATRTADEWVRLFSEADLMAARCNEYGEVARDPQVLENKYITQVDAGDGTRVPMVGVPVIMSKTPGRIRGIGPEFGQHTEEVLLEFGFTWDEIGELAEAGVIGHGARERVAT